MASEKDNKKQEASADKKQTSQEVSASKKQEAQSKDQTAQDDRAKLDETAKAYRDRGGRAAKVDTNPPEAQQNNADWLENRDPKDVVEVEGQRETAEARMARNGVASPEKQAGATTIR